MPARPRVLQVLQPEDGGVAEHVLLLSRGLVRRGWEVEVALSEASTIVPKLGAAGIRLHGVPMLRRPGAHDVRAAWTLRRIDRRGGFDLVHAHSSKAGALVRLALRDRRRLVYTPNCLPFAMGVSPRERGIYRAVEQALVPRSGAIVAVCDWERDVAVTTLRGARDRIHVIHNGVGSCPDVEPAAELMEFKGDRPLAGMVAGLRPQKDPLTAIRAAALLTRPAGARIAIVGNGELRDAVQRKIATLGLSERVRWFRFEPPAARYLRALDVFVLPARWEALPLAIAEAMHCALPVVATPVGGVAEMVEDGVTGKLVPPGDPRPLAAAIAELLGDRDRRTAMGRAGQAAAEARFGVDRMVERTEDLYRDLLAACA